MKFKTGRGFGDFNKTAAEQKEKAERNKNKLWRFFLKDGESDIPIRFLTEEPICFYEHVLKDGNKYDNVSCTGDDCPHCAEGLKPQWVGAWLVVDGREYKVKVRKDGKETGETKTLTDRIRLFVRGTRDVSKLEAKAKKFGGLTSRMWYVSRTGTGQATNWEFERGDGEDRLSPKELDAILQQLPPEIRSMDLYEIIELQVNPEMKYPEPVAEKKEATVQKARSGVRPSSNDDDDDEEAPAAPPKVKKFGFTKRGV